MSAWPDADWLNPLIALLQAVQLALLRLLSWLGVAGTSEGQPAWPFALRLSGENLLIDLGQGRRLALTLCALALATAMVLLALFWRRGRAWLAGLALLLVVLAPWPAAHVLLVPAVATSFHRSPTGFSAGSIVQGGALYAQHCVGCHGADGRGQGPLAATQPVWPPNLAGPLLWRRADGDLLWHILHGMQDRRGHATMPAFGAQFGGDEAWALIDFMKAQGAGESLRATGVWAQPVAAPDMSVRCDHRAPRPLASWRGQRLRIVAADARSVPTLNDPRLVTIAVGRATDSTRAAAADCTVESADAWQALALIAGTGALAGTELLVDRDGWLRARGEPGQGAWSDDDLLCRTGSSPEATQRPPAADGLGALIARIDAEPVRFVKGGFVH